MYVNATEPVRPSAIPGLEHATLAGSRDGLAHLSIWRQRIAVGGATPPHRHDCEEVVLIERGRGTLTIEGVEHAFTAGSTIVVPADVPHQIFNTGDVPLECTAVFSVTPVQVRFPDGTPLELPWAT